MPEISTIPDLLEAADRTSIAIAAPGRAPLTYGGLRRLVSSTVDALNDFGVGRNDRVAIVLPNGPEMAAAFVAIGAGATTAPLNPAYRADEFDFYMTDLRAKALVVMEGDDSPAVEIAKKLTIPILRLAPDPDQGAGAFTLLAEGGTARTEKAAATGYAAAEDKALVLHTSGTTSRPKIVPLTHTNITASAHHIGKTLQLTHEDRCLNIMPLFHIHGLIAAVLSSLAAGGTVFCTPGFSALRFFTWLDEAEPSWYTAVPTMHQAILARAERNRESVERAKLRFIRSSSASLPPPVMRELEELFRCPVIEAYGMTEAAHQMASNPLPPRPRKPGTVGLPAGPEIRIIDEQGAPLPQGERGEVAIRGPNVTKGYENNPEANAAAFTEDGWFRTGDQGVFDADGYLTITGRLKEIINRGGEKISPREVDDVLCEHPAVQQAVTFAIPHAMLGEEVGAAIVLREESEVTEQQIKDWASLRIAEFKVPRRIVFLDELPKGPTGKVQRIGLAERLGLAET